MISEEKTNEIKVSKEIPAGVSIESASYIENYSDNQEQVNDVNQENFEEEGTPKLFSDDTNQVDVETNRVEAEEEGQLFEKDNNEEEDFEIPAFLRRQKF